MNATRNVLILALMLPAGLLRAENEAPAAGTPAFETPAAADAEVSAVPPAEAEEQPRRQPQTVRVYIPVSGEYGPTGMGDTLWSIASQLAAAQQVSPQRMLKALRRANPAAFNKNDSNSLIVGAMLKIPALGSIAAPPPASGPATLEAETPPAEPAAAQITADRQQIETLEQQLDSTRRQLANRDRELAGMQTAPRHDDAPENRVIAGIGSVLAVVLLLAAGWSIRRRREPDGRQPKAQAVPPATPHAAPIEATTDNGLAETGSADEFDYNFRQIPQIPDQPAEDDALETGFEDFEEILNLETSIDLAKAYLDMGDLQAAKDVLEEVLEKGTKQQRTVARGLLAEMDISGQE